MEKEYGRFRQFNRVYWIVAIIMTAISMLIGGVAGICLAASVVGANSDIEVVMWIIFIIIAAVMVLFVVMILYLLISLPYVIFNSIHLYKFSKANITYDKHMTFALVMTIIMGFYDFTTITSLMNSLISVIYAMIGG